MQMLCRMQMQNADADAKQMQNAECRMQVQNALQIRLHCRIADQKIELELLRSQTACAPEALGRILRASPHAAGPHFQGYLVSS